MVYDVVFRVGLYLFVAEAVINPAGPEDEQDTASESTVYTPRMSAGNRGNNAVEQNVLSETHAMNKEHRQGIGAKAYTNQCNSFRKSSRLPTGGSIPSLLPMPLDSK